MEPEAETPVGQPEVSVIMATYAAERLKDVREAVHSVLLQRLKPYEVIVAVSVRYYISTTLMSPRSPMGRTMGVFLMAGRRSPK